MFRSIMGLLSFGIRVGRGLSNRPSCVICGRPAKYGLGGGNNFCSVRCGKVGGYIIKPSTQEWYPIEYCRVCNKISKYNLDGEHCYCSVKCAAEEGFKVYARNMTWERTQSEAKPKDDKMESQTPETTITTEMIDTIAYRIKRQKRPNELVTNQTVFCPICGSQAQIQAPKTIEQCEKCSSFYCPNYNLTFTPPDTEYASISQLENLLKFLFVKLGYVINKIDNISYNETIMYISQNNTKAIVCLCFIEEITLELINKYSYFADMNHVVLIFLLFENNVAQVIKDSIKNDKIVLFERNNIQTFIKQHY